MTGTVVRQQDWLRSRNFDIGFIGGSAALGLSAGLIVIIRPELFGLVLVLDLWLLGYHHVISTFTRFVVDRATIRNHMDLLTWWPIAIAALVAALGYGIGPWTLVTIYLYWQWFHYLRQSWGVGRAYERRSSVALPESPVLYAAMFHAVPLWGILHRSRQAPEQFLGVEVWTIPVPGPVVDAVGLAAVVLVGLTVHARFGAWRRGELPVAHTLMLVSHLTVFLCGYVVIDSIDTGWLTINVWHNVQYIAFVWHANNCGSASTNRRGLARHLGGTGRLAPYLLLCLAASTALYIALGLTLAAAATPVIVYQTINFHHYVVDGSIWKARRSVSPVAASFGVG